jgi:ABC-type nitrate/sulfonate/bicarbonate transport system ATPase subunit
MGEGREATADGRRRPSLLRVGGVRRACLLRSAPRRGREVSALDAIKLRGVSRSFDIAGTRLLVLDGVDLRVAEREVVAIVGPNGCGKSTLLRIMSGLLPSDDGEVSSLGARVVGVDARIGLVFQEPRLLPWRTLLDNVALPLELAGVSRAERQSRALEALALTDLRDFADAMPHQLSGGMAQRAALARALTPRPGVLLLDEPFSALDAMTRERLDDELLYLWNHTGTTIVLVTHSIAEAVFLADRVLVMSPRPGRMVADVPVRAGRPRQLSGGDAALFGATADEVRRLLANAERESRNGAAA